MSPKTVAILGQHWHLKMDMPKRLNLILPLFIFVTLACSLPASMTLTPEIPATVTETPFQPQSFTPLPELVIATPALSNTPTLPSRLTLEQIKNGEYIWFGTENALPQSYYMDNGSYQRGTAPEQVSIRLGEPIGYGDLDGDDVEDCAVLLTENYGGSGQFILIGTVYNQNGQPLHTTSYGLGDRTLINTLNIQNGEIIIDAIVHGPQDPMCCPSIPASIHLRPLTRSKLMITRYITRTPTGQERSINIRTPLSGAEATNSITLTGDITIAPFENNLTYTVYDAGHQPLTQSYIMVDSPDFGAPGTFTLTLDLSSLGYIGDIYVEITDLSAADGSTLALAQVWLKVR